VRTAHRPGLVGFIAATLAGLGVMAVSVAGATEPFRIGQPAGAGFGPTSNGARIITVQSGKGAGPGHPHHRRIPKHQQPAVENPHAFGPSYPFGYNYKGPSYPFGNNYSRSPIFDHGKQYGNYGKPHYVAPPTTYVAPVKPAPRWVPGYWGQQWVPQYYTYDAWVPGYFARNGAWMPGYYEQRVGESGGYYERVWVDGYWAE
jgi:hypothetical protein